MNSCPCCSRALLRHICSSGIYWHCSSCRQEMPNFKFKLTINTQTKLRKKLSYLRLDPKAEEVLAN